MFQYLRELVVYLIHCPSGTKTKSPGANQSSCPLPLFPRPVRSKYRHLIMLLCTVIHWPGFFFSFSLGFESLICYSNGKRFVELSFTSCVESTCHTFLFVVVLKRVFPALRHECKGKSIVCLKESKRTRCTFLKLYMLP